MLRLSLRMKNIRLYSFTTVKSTARALISTHFNNNSPLHNTHNTSTAFTPCYTQPKPYKTHNSTFLLRTMASSSMPPPSSSTNPQGVPPLSPSEPALDTTNTTETTLKPTDIVMVYVTVPSKDMGRTIAHTLVSEKLAACTNIVPGLESIYYWDGKVNADEELLLLIKTRAGLLPELTVKVKELHPYDECEVVAVPVVGGSESYLQWVRDSTKDSNSI